MSPERGRGQIIQALTSHGEELGFCSTYDRKNWRVLGRGMTGLFYIFHSSLLATRWRVTCRGWKKDAQRGDKVGGDGGLTVEPARCAKGSEMRQKGNTGVKDGF